MTQVSGVFWRDIPAQVIVKAGRRTAKRMLSARFQDAIDGAALRGKAIAADAYLEEWRRVVLEPPADSWSPDPEAAADQAAAFLEDTYDAARLATLVAAAGRTDPQ